MKIFDSNLIIYSSLDKYSQLRRLINMPDACVSAITKVETLGYHKLPEEDRNYFEAVFMAIKLMPVTEAVINKAVDIRQRKKMSLGDCIIAATALLNGFDLYTNNTKDFIDIPGLMVVNPLNEQ